MPDGLPWLLTNLTFPGFAPNLLWSIPIGVTSYLMLFLLTLSVRDMRSWIRGRGASNREAIGFLYFPILVLGLYALLDVTLSIYDPVVAYQAGGIACLLVVRKAVGSYL